MEYPSKIYLCEGLGETTWCEDRVDESDVEYIKVDTLSDSIKDIEWVGECDECLGTKWVPVSTSRSWLVETKKCLKCNGTGTITRPATLAECIELLKCLMEYP